MGFGVRLWGLGFGVLAFGSLGCGSSVPENENLGSVASALNCTGVVGVANPTSPAPLGSTVHLSATATCGTQATEFAFLWQSAGTPTASGYIQNWSSSNSADWNTAGFNGTFNLYSYVRHQGGVAQEATHILGPYLVGRVCNAVTLNVSPAAALGTSPTLGTPVTLTASASCLEGGTAEYQFYYIQPGTATYVQIPQAGVSPGGWGGASATLDTTNLGAGKYSFQVRTRAVGNTSGQEAMTYGPANYYIGDVCWQAPTITASPPSPQPRGGNIALTASSSCLRAAVPEYKFLYKLSTAGTYTDMTGWGGPTATWSTAALGAGTYYIEVLVRGQGNASATEGYNIASYTLSGGYPIAANGVAQTQIYRGAHERAQNGAADLAAILGQMTGATFTPQVIPTSVPSTGIFVASADSDAGVVPAAITWPSGTEPTLDEAFVIKSVGGQLWLVGKTQLGVRHAVSRFLHDLGYRYFFQGRNWEVIPSSPTLTYSGDTVADQPRTVMRALSGHAFAAPLNAAGHSQSQDQNDWRKRNGLAYNYVPTGGGSTIYSNTALGLAVVQGAFGAKMTPTGSGNIYNFIDQVNAGNVPVYPAQVDANNQPVKYAANWFDLAADRYGELSPNPYNSIEVSNPAVRDCFWSWVTQKDPNRLVWPNITVEPNDGALAVSRSASALAIGNDADQLVYLANDLLARIAQHPEVTRKYVTMNAAYHHITPPKNQIASPGVYVGVLPLIPHTVGNFTSTSSLMTAWAARGAKVGLWHNYSYKDRGVMGPGYNSTLLGQSPDYLNDSIALGRELRDQGVAGSVMAVFETEDNFGRYGIGYYLTSQLIWNPNADVDALRLDFFGRAFPSSTAFMQQYFDLFNPRDKPMLVTSETLGKALSLLKQAGDAATAAGSTGEVARINDLKAFMHHNALWWRLQRAPYCGVGQCTIADPQPALTVELLNWDYRNRHSYMTSYQQDRILGSYDAFQQFGLSEFNTSTLWEQGGLLTASEIESAFAQDQLLFPNPTSPVQQLTWSGDPVAISGFSGSTAAFDIGNSSTAGLSVALYTSSGSVSLEVMTGRQIPGNFPTAYPDDQIPGTRVWLTDVAGNQLLDTSGQPLSQTLPPQLTAGGTYQTMTFSNITPPAGVPAGSNFGVIAHFDNGGYRMVVHTTTSKRIAWMGDKIVRPSNLATPSWGYYFYVPKGTASIKFTWNRSGMTFANDLVSVALHAPLVFDDTGAAQTYSAGPQEIASIAVPAGHDGKLWRVQTTPSTWASQLWFYNVPPYFAASPNEVVLPRDLALADNLSIVP